MATKPNESSPARGTPSVPKVVAIPNAHIDPVWLWQWQEGYQEVRATFRSANVPSPSSCSATSVMILRRSSYSTRSQVAVGASLRSKVLAIRYTNHTEGNAG